MDTTVTTFDSSGRQTDVKTVTVFDEPPPGSVVAWLQRLPGAGDGKVLGLSGGSPAWVAAGTAAPAVATVDNGDGTFTVSGVGVTDNGDGTFTVSDVSITDNGDGTFALAA